MELKIEYVPVGDLIPYENNTRRHAPDDIDQIKASIEADGFNDPIGVWHNIIVEGHGRLIAAKEIGLEKVPVIRLDHLTDTQRRDYAIRHNRTAELSAWDFGKLEEEIARLEIEGVDLSGLKFDLDALNGGAVTTIDNTSKEYGEEDFSDDKFECECPRCGFKFNR
jgi:ParB-like chromosome segregation protein Spo0J